MQAAQHVTIGARLNKTQFQYTMNDAAREERFDGYRHLVRTPAAWRVWERQAESFRGAGCDGVRLRNCWCCMIATEACCGGGVLGGAQALVFRCRQKKFRACAEMESRSSC